MNVNTPDSCDVVVVGAGIAGLVCAIELVRAGKSVLVLEAAGAVGGRVGSSEIEGCTIDHGFQVLFTAYPVITPYLDLPALALRAFRPAANVMVDNRRSLIGDALRDPTLLLDAVRPGVVPLTDKLRLLALRQFARSLSTEDCFSSEYTSVTTREYLLGRGFSQTVVNRFFAPFYGGVLLDRSLGTNAGILLFTFKMLSEGDTAVPARGMRAIPEQLAAQLPHDAVRLHARVRAVRTASQRACGVVLDDGSEITAEEVVLATDLRTTALLASTVNVTLDDEMPVLGSTSLYFRATRSPLPGKSLWLNGDENAEISHAITMTEVAPEYADDGVLLVATAFGAAARNSDDELEGATRQTISRFANIASLQPPPDLTRVAVQRIPFSQFAQAPGFRPAPARISPALPGLWRASELMHSSSIDGAARGGKMTAMALLETNAGRTSSAR